MFSVVVHLVELVSNHMLRWIGLKLVTMWIAQKCISSVNARIHIQSGLKLVRNCSVNRPLLSSIRFVNTLRQLHEEERKQELPRIVVILPLVEALLRQLNTFEPPRHLHWCTMTQMLHT